MSGFYPARILTAPLSVPEFSQKIGDGLCVNSISTF